MAEPGTERVKWCLHCEAILPFDQETCSVCGASAAAGGADEAVRPCLTCSELIPEADFFCPKCGDFALAVPAHDGGAPAWSALEAGAVTTLQRILAITLCAAGAVLVIAVVREWTDWRALLL
jgi:RNA polymerase subunit RPABC4/transcription elongation factor Spt4